MNRSAQVIATGQYLVPMIADGVMPDPDSDSALAWLTNLCATFGLPTGSLRIVDWDDDEPDPRGAEGKRLADPNVSPPEPAPAPSPLTQLKDVLLADPNLADATKQAIKAIAGGDEVAVVDAPLVPQKG